MGIIKTQCNYKQLKFQGLGRRKVNVDFKGGSITSYVGVLLLQEVNLAHGFIKGFD